MSYRLPQDIEIELQKRFKEVHIPSVVDAIFQFIIQKIAKDSNCTIREFGKFIAFVTYSEKTAKNLVRFKFKLSSAFSKKLKTDRYLMENLPVKAKTPFTKQNEDACKDKQCKKQANLEAVKRANQISKKKTDEAVAAETVHRIITSGAK